MERRTDFMNILLGLEAQKILANRSKIMPAGLYGPEAIEAILIEVAWEYIKKGNPDMLDYVARLTGKSLEEILNDKKALRGIAIGTNRNSDAILVAIGVNKKLIKNVTLINTAVNLIVEGYGFNQIGILKDFMSPQPYDHQIIGDLTSIWEKRKEIEDKTPVRHKHCTEELPLLISFLKESVFTF
jgi:hypothetical protein